VRVYWREKSLDFMWKLPLTIPIGSEKWLRSDYLDNITTIITECGKDISREELLMTLKSYGFICLK
jgi:hypothetical protein